MSARFWANKPTWVKLVFRALFCTVFSFLTHVFNFKKSNSYVERFDANFKQQHSWFKVNLELRAPFRKVQGNLRLCTLFRTSVTLHVTALLLFYLGFWQKTQISRNSDLHTLFYTNLANLKMSPRFWPNKPIWETLNKNGKYQDVCTFLSSQAYLVKFTVMRGVFNNF